ncbi:GntR family transcriptional regulator [Pseudonocardia sp. GCM10023141]|uniref:GntR family transcriptional regulator n=1 Tax=Pseudonocardia sp. GCM10023141 TaxID=3252653 RepID=UPI00360FAD14
MAISTAVTRTDELYARIRGDILGGRLVPGEHLRFPQLPQHYEASVGATREVLTRLAADGLVLSEARRGYRVRPLSHSDLLELTQARVEQESLVLRLSITDGDTSFEAQAVAAHHMLERAPYLDEADPSHPTPVWAAAHAAFHEALLAGCANRRLLATALSLRAEAELYRAWGVAFGGDSGHDVAQEHRMLLHHTVGRDTDAAVQLLRDHIAHTAQLLISCAPDQPNRIAAAT